VTAPGGRHRELWIAETPLGPLVQLVLQGGDLASEAQPFNPTRQNSLRSRIQGADERTVMKRRNALQLIAIGAASPLAAQHAGHATATEAASAVALRFFTPQQSALVDCLAEMILPADDHSPGAHEAQVAAFIDDLLADSSASEQQTWSSGLAAVDAEAQARFEKVFVECSDTERNQILAEMAAGEGNPSTTLQRFFVGIKMQTISGYYTSRVGLLQDLQYKGIVPIAEFEACTHPEHGG